MNILWTCWPRLRLDPDKCRRCLLRASSAILRALTPLKNPWRGPGSLKRGGERDRRGTSSLSPSLRWIITPVRPSKPRRNWRSLRYEGCPLLFLPDRHDNAKTVSLNPGHLIWHRRSGRLRMRSGGDGCQRVREGDYSPDLYACPSQHPSLRCFLHPSLAPSAASGSLLLGEQRHACIRQVSDRFYSLFSQLRLVQLVAVALLAVGPIEKPYCSSSRSVPDPHQSHYTSCVDVVCLLLCVGLSR